MARFFACRTLFQNPLFSGKNKLTNAAPTKGNNTSTVLYTPIFALVITPPVVSALFFIAQYLENNF